MGVAFEVLPSGKKAPVGWRKVTGHIIFDVKMDFTRKARWGDWMATKPHHQLDPRMLGWCQGRLFVLLLHIDFLYSIS